jgi:filamentous hemagglutinin
MDASSLDKSLEKKASHIFRNAEGHFHPDTPFHRQLLIETVLDSSNYIGTDKWNNDWYSQILSDQTQVWVQVRKGKIINGGLNPTPRPWNTVTGFSRPLPP